MTRADFLEDAEIFAGSPKTLQWLLTTGSAIVVREIAEVGATSLEVQAIEQALVSGDRIRFGYAVVTVGAAGAPIGARSIPISASAARLERHARGAKVINASSFTLRLRIDSGTDPGGSPASLETTPTGDADGLITTPLTAANTTALGEGSFVYRLDRTNVGVEYNVAYGEIKIGALSPAAVAP